MDIEKTPNGHKLLDVIRIIAFHGETGRLQMTAGSTQGVFFFKDGSLVDARLGALTGFQAINVAVSMGEAHFGFEPSNTPTFSSSITATERTILKQFFDIETVDPECDHHVRVAAPDWNNTPNPVVPLRDVDVKELSHRLSDNDVAAGVHAAENEFGALTTEEAPSSEINVDRDTVEKERFAPASIFFGLLSTPSRHRAGLALVMLVGLTGVLAFALVNRLKDQRISQLAKQNEPAIAEQGGPAVAKPSEPIDKQNQSSQRTDSLQVPGRSNQTEQGRALAQDLTGEWKLVNNVKKTAYRSFNDLEIGFRLVINQTGSKFTANGEKISENGRTLPASGRTPIQVSGSINGDRIEATFVEEGVVRKTSGRFVWRIQSDGSGLAGTFVSSAARSSGKSAATKEL
ncbi:MAG TPA: DUF4388 domain-containing protein [Pyrinomonadaceae bacterium]